MISVGEKHTCLPLKCHFMCMLASSAVSDMFNRLFNGMIKVKEVEIMFKKKAQVLKLCTADQQQSEFDVEETLEKRNMECSAFLKHKLQIDTFCRQLRNSRLHIEGKDMCDVLNRPILAVVS